MAVPVTVAYINDEHASTWPGARDGDLLWFDFTRASGESVRLWVLPAESAMLISRPGTTPYIEWLVHIVECVKTQEDPEHWRITDREIDIIVEPDLRTYRVIDLEEFGAAIASGRIPPTSAAELLSATQRFLDKYLHGGGRFPPAEIGASDGPSKR